MTRFALAVGLLATAASARSEAGYFVVRVLVEAGTGSAAGPAPGPGGLFPPPPGGGGDDPDNRGGSAGGGFRPPMGQPPGGYGPPGGLGMARPAAAPAGPAGDPARSIYVVVPFTRKPGSAKFYKNRGDHIYFNPSWPLHVTHRLGSTNLFIDNHTIQVYNDFVGLSLTPTQTRQTVLLDRYAKWAKESGDPQLLLDYLFEALEYGMVAEAVRMADDLLAVTQQPKKGRITPPVEAFAAAYAKVQKGLKDLPTQRGDGPYWAERLGVALPGAKHLTRGHYTLVYWDAAEAEQARRFGQLEDNFKAFYLWHAARGKALPFPDKPLMAVLPSTGNDTLYKLGAALDRMAIVADGFYVPEYDLLILSPERLDEVGRTFDRQVKQLYREGVSVPGLLAGEGPQVDASGTNPNFRRPEEVARLMTYAMVQRYAQEADEWGAVSREGGRQLFYATGLLPRHVSLPVWLSNGSVAFWSRPRGVVLTTRGEGELQKTYATIGLATGFGGPNYIRQKQFRELVEKKQLNADPGLTLRNVVTDVYFNASQDKVDADDPRLPLPAAAVRKKAAPGSITGSVGSQPAPPPPTDPLTLDRQRQEFLTAKKYATSWALYYYLVKYQPEGLRRYVAELAAMPRDLPFDESTRLDAFARAFNLTTGPTREGDKATFAEFAAVWIKTLNNLPLAGVEFELVEPAAAPPAAGAAMPGPFGGGGIGGGGAGGGTPGGGDN